MLYPFKRVVAVAVLVAVAIFVAAAAGAQESPAKEVPEVDGVQFARFMKELNNWGRWGEDDRLGALNLITAQKRREAVGLVKSGVAVSLAHPVLTEKAADNDNVFDHTMVPTGSSPWTVDRLSVLYHGLAHTHMDALCHVSYDGQFYNGLRRQDVTEDGCPNLGIERLPAGVFTRGILIDIAWLRGVEALEPATPVTLADLELWEERTGVEIRPGDAILLRTGRWARRAAEGPWSTGEGFAGFHASTIPWLKAKDPSILGSDAGLDVMPSQLVEAPGVSPLHMFSIVALGANILDNGDFEELSAEAQRQGRWDFLITFAPLRVEGGTGSPINPIAVF